MQKLSLSRKILQWVFLALALSVAALWNEVRKLPDGHVHFWMFDIGQGDSLFLQSPSGRQVMIDAGPDLTSLTRLGEVLPRSDKDIDLLVLTHPHLDHLAAFPEILRQYHIGAVILTGVQYSGERYREMLEEIRRQGIHVILPNPGKDLDFGDGLVLDVLWPYPGLFDKKIPENDVHTTTVVLRAIFGDHSILLTGDTEEPTENAILHTGADVSANVLKVGHHGSKTSTSTGFLLEAHPQVALISAGKNNKFHHPDQLVLDRLIHFGIPFHVTKDEGTIHLVW